MVNVLFKKGMEGGVELSADEMFGQTGKAPMTDNGGRRERARRLDSASDGPLLRPRARGLVGEGGGAVLGEHEEL